MGKNNLIFKKIKFAVLCLVLVFLAAGCATYGQGVKKCLDNVKACNYQDAEKELQKAIKPDGKDRLLYYMELGSIKRLDQRFMESNASFQQAENIAEDLYTKKAKDLLASMLLNPRLSPYQGNEFENIYINYFKALNYLDLALDEVKSDHVEAPFENAKIELKRLDYKLDSFAIEKGNYKNVKDKKQKTFVKLLDIFKKFQGNWLDKDWLQFREDANARYLAGIIYELSGDFDSARISYQKAAELYEQGYVKQYSLDEEITERAWYDTIRMMLKAGGWENEWRQYAKSKLSDQKRKELSENISSGKGEIIIIEHFGMAPQRKELNLILKADKKTSSLYLYPVLTGKPMDKNDQRAWFFLLYSDKGVLDIINNYSQGGLSQAVRGLQRKTISLGPLWKTAEDLSLIQAIGDLGVRVTVPYYSPLRKDTGVSVVNIGNIHGRLIKSEDIGRLGIQNQLLNSGKDLNAALARASLKNVLADQATNDLGGLAMLTGKIAAAATSAAETRNWLLLPREIRVNRFRVPAGEHNVQIISKTAKGTVLGIESKKINVKPGEIKVWAKRTIVD